MRQGTLRGEGDSETTDIEWPFLNESVLRGSLNRPVIM